MWRLGNRVELPLWDNLSCYFVTGNLSEFFKVTRMFACDFLEIFSIIQLFSLKIRVFCGEMVFYFPENIASFDIFSSQTVLNGTGQV
jgi:hypothetical protein